jgi:xylulose-5-phosphate/fructose-6-phosphate phosphoketolase
MGNNRFTNPVIKPLVLPNFEAYAVNIDSNGRGETLTSNTFTVGTFLRDVIEKNHHHRNFRMFGPDETKSNKLDAIYEITDKQWMGESSEDDVNISTDGRMMEMLSEHQCEGWLEGYLLTGGHGLFNSYEAFIHIISSMFNQHAKWLETTKKIPWRNALSSLNILLSSHAWRQDHNGFTHQDPGFLSHVMTKKPEITRIYLPPDANCLLSVMHHCLQSRHYCNVMVAGKQQSPQWLSQEEAAQHCKEGLGIWEWASSDVGVEPDIILACAGDVPTIEALAATTILRDKLPRLHVRFVNVVDLMKLYTPDHHPHGLPNNTFDSIFTRDKPVLFNFHAYPQMIEKLVYDRNNRNFVVRGYHEEGTITTPFDMCVFNGIDRYNLVIDTCDLIETKCPTVDNKTRWTATYVRQEMKKLLQKHKKHIYEYGLDMEEVANWKWTA